MEKRAILFLEKKIGKKFNPGNIVEFKNQGSRYNRVVFLEDGSGDRFLLKIVPNGKAEIGEENVTDIVYDCLVHQMMSCVLGWNSFRKLIDYSVDPISMVGGAYALTSTVPGVTVGEDWKDLSFSSFIEKSCKILLVMASKMKFSNSCWKIPPTLFKKFKVSLPLEMKRGQNALFPVTNEHLYSSPVVQYFKSDVIRWCPELYKAQFVNYIDSQNSEVTQPHMYTVIHSDLKPSNAIFRRESGEINFIDWSRAAIGDCLIDYADLLCCCSVYSNGTEVLGKNVALILDTLSKMPSQLLGMGFEQRIKFYASSKFFSIARIFAPKIFEAVCESLIFSWNLPLELFFANQVLLKGVRF